MQAQEDTEDWQFTDALVGQLLQLKIVLEVVCIDSPGDEEFRAAKDGNLRILERLLGQVHHRLQRVCTPAEMRGAFPFSETSATAQYSGPLTIADSMTIEVKARSPHSAPLPSNGLSKCSCRAPLSEMQ